MNIKPPVSGKFHDVTVENGYSMSVSAEVERGPFFQDATTADLASVAILDPRESDVIFSLANKNYDYYLFVVHAQSFDRPVVSKLEFTYRDLEELGWHVVLGP